jgi:hypothetical protein
MVGQGESEVFRRSWLTVVPEWIVAGAVARLIILAAGHFGFQSRAEADVLAALPLVWAAGRTLQWAHRRWVVTADRQLVLLQGVLVRTRQVIYLHAVDQVQVEVTWLGGRLDTGHIAFQVTDRRGQRHPMRWTWVGACARLCEILRAQGRLPVGRPTRWRQAWHVAAKRSQAMGTGLALAWVLGQEALARLQGRWFAEDYGRFLAFCHHLLRTRGGERRWPPSGTPAAVERCWMAVLRQARVVVDAPEGRGWRVAGAIRRVEDVRQRIGEEELRRGVQRSAR